MFNSKNYPVAKKISTDDKTNDEYSWLRDNNWPKVTDKHILEYLEEENSYANSFFADHKILQNQIIDELKSRVIANYETYPIKDCDYFYYIRFETDKNYPIYCRKYSDLETSEIIILDVNILAGDKSGFSLGEVSVSSSHKMIAYSEDLSGEERYVVSIKNLETDTLLSDKIYNTDGVIIWDKKDSGFFYIKKDEHWRSNRVFFHKLGEDQEQDLLIYEENNDIFHVGISYSSDKNIVFITTQTSMTSEIWFIKLDDFIEDNPKYKAQLLIARSDKLLLEKDVLYYADYIDNYFYISTNDKGKNFRLVRFTDKNSKWEELVAHDEKNYLIDFNLYKQYIVITKKIEGLNHIKILDINSLHEFSVEFTEETYYAATQFTNFQDEHLRIIYSALNTPKTILEYNFKDKTLYTRKHDIIPNYDKELYKVKRLYAKSGDVSVPISLIYKKNQRKENMPSLLYGYGSYGISVEPRFNANIISLLDRGYIYAIAHIRGGDDLGFDWYESAKFLNKKKSFEDFISCAKYLKEEKYTDNISIIGGSAGGMLVGSVINICPDLFQSAIALVPFVDVLNTMLDESLPLTPSEFLEWGNPKEKEYFDYIKSYSPYDNIEAQKYPHIFVTAGLTDPRVGYWEPAKFVAKLRDRKTDDNLLLFKTEMEAGHQGAQGRYKSLVEMAEIYIFLLYVHNIKALS